jgi:hypothetical protein
MVNAIKELYAELQSKVSRSEMVSAQVEIEKLKSENIDLKSKNHELEQRLERLEKAIQAK